MAKSTTKNNDGTTPRKIQKNRLGFMSKSKNGKSTLITVEQDMTLTAGTRLILQKPADEVDSLVRNGVIEEDEGEARKVKIPEWKLYNINVLPNNQE